MSLITYLKDIIESYRIAPPDLEVEYIKDMAIKPVEEPFKPVSALKVDEKTNQFIPKEMNWLNWEDSNFRNALLDSQIKTESGGNPHARSGAGAVGLAQFMPGTWEDAKKFGWVSPNAERTDPTESLKAQKALMNDLYNKPEMKNSLTEEERYAKALAAYNAGYGNLRKAITKSTAHGGYWLDYMSNETRKYVPLIMNRAEEEYFKDKENYVSKYKRD